jgi:hypothetical protein
MNKKDYNQGYIDALTQLKIEIKELKADVGCMFWGGEYGWQSAITSVGKKADELINKKGEENV